MGGWCVVCVCGVGVCGVEWVGGHTCEGGYRKATSDPKLWTRKLSATFLNMSGFGSCGALVYTGTGTLYTEGRKKREEVADLHVQDEATHWSEWGMDS